MLVAFSVRSQRMMRRGGRPAILQSCAASEPEADSCVEACDPIVRHNAQAAGQRFGLASREWLPNIEQPKKYKTHEEIFPVEWGSGGHKSQRTIVVGGMRVEEGGQRAAEK